MFEIIFVVVILVVVVLVLIEFFIIDKILCFFRNKVFWNKISIYVIISMKIVKIRVIGLKCIDKLIDNDINLDIMESNNCVFVMLYNILIIFVIKNMIICLSVNIFKMFCCVKLINWNSVNLCVWCFMNKWLVYIKKMIIMINKNIDLIKVFFLMMVIELLLFIFLVNCKVVKLKYKMMLKNNENKYIV